MIKTAKNISGRILIALSVCVLLSCVMWSQAKPGSAAVSNNPITPANGNPSSSAPPAPHDNTYVIGKDDVLAVNVWKEPEISRSVPVRSDGKISLPLVGEIQAAGETPLKLEQGIAARLKSYIEEPEVTVIVQEIKSQNYNILGMVNKAGSFPLLGSITVLDAIAAAGGFKDFAKQKNIYILRQNPDGSQSRLPFNYKEVIKGHNSAQNVMVQARDTIVVP